MQVTIELHVVSSGDSLIGSIPYSFMLHLSLQYDFLYLKEARNVD
jgi:hypothetical protein